MNDNLKIKILLTIYSLLIVGQIFCQESNDVIVLPGEGVIIQNDTFMLGIAPLKLLTEIDTAKHKVNIIYTSGHSDGIEILEDSITGQKTSKEIYWTTYYCDINILDYPVYFKFEGDSKEKISLNKIKIDFPCKAITTNGLEVGSHKSEIFKIYSERQGSYNCGENGFYYCYYKYGISFGVKPYKENPNPEMFEKIVSFEVYKKTE